MENPYNITDPAKLLELKRLENDALLDVLRTINHAELTIDKLCLIARNVLRAQLGVKKMIFYFETRGKWSEGFRLGVGPLPFPAYEELLTVKKIIPVKASTHPHLFQTSVEYVIPISSQETPQAYFLIGDFADSEVEAQNDLIFIETLGNIMLVAIQNKELFEEKMRRELLLQELEVAEKIQSQLLISDFSRFKEIDVFGTNIPHHHIGGDFYDVIKKEKGTTFVCIADVSGKGIAAALLMSNLQANLRALCAQYTDLETIIKELNLLLYKITSGEKFVTLFLARIDKENQSFTYVNAGHNYPFLIKGEEVYSLDQGCLLLGIVPELEVSQHTLSFEEADTLFMYTDGVPEQRNQQDQMFGQEKLKNALLQVKRHKAADMIQYLKVILEQYSDQTGWHDDITMLAVKFVSKN
ncbi:MAG: PP2C family protein-serine/threonine phosphatase [Bacteroidota bacterium]